MLIQLSDTVSQNLDDSGTESPVSGRDEICSLPILKAGELLQCEYHLMNFDGLEISQPSTPTLRRRRRGAVIGTGRDRSLIRSRDGIAGTHSLRPDISAIENSVVWETSGKGDTDFGLHFFERREARDHQPLELYRPYRFRTVCPNSPLTYHGQLLSITWMVRVRIFLTSGDGLTFEHRFQLVNH